jgi:ADP-ribosylglycohydrolase
MKRNQDHFQGCLLGGAIGDALGWPVEFLKLKDIQSRWGDGGIQDLDISTSGKAEITDDTQMTLFTAEGILRAETRGNRKGICEPTSVVYNAYQRWLLTQGYPGVPEYEWFYDGWLLDTKALYARRAPGNSCLSALSGKKHGTMAAPINNSKGCGGIMRMAPAGLFYPLRNAFQMAAEFAALTHGHPSGYLSAGALAYIIAAIIEGQNLQNAVAGALSETSRYDGAEECLKSIKLALALAKGSAPANEAITQLGEGWVGEEALGIAIYCALKYENDFEKALICSVNHDGDSDSTGAITGNILGATLGLGKIPNQWVERVELKGVICQVADDLLTGYQEGQTWWDRYPGY